MTDLIDLNYLQNKFSQKHSSCSRSSFYQQQSVKVNCIHQVIQKFVNKIGKINIKTVEVYVFQLDKTKILFGEIFYYFPVKIVGVISLGNGIFTLRIQFFDQKGGKISAKSLHHRTVISSFAFQINAELQNFKLQYNPVSGQFSFIFNIKAEYLDKALVSQLVEFALDSYFEQQCPGHFYVLHLIQYLDENQNQYIKSVEEDFKFFKKWVKERQIQNRKVLKSFPFYEKLTKKIQVENCNEFSFSKRAVWKKKNIQKYLIHGSDKFSTDQELCPYRVREVFKRFKKMHEEQSIIRQFLASKSHYQNILTVNPKETKSLLEFMTVKNIQKKIESVDEKYMNIIQNPFNRSEESFTSLKLGKDNDQVDSQDKFESEINEEALRIWDKETGKYLCVKMLHPKTNAKTQNFLLQKLCKCESYYFINQYVHLQNYMMQNELVLVNVHPKRTTLSEFLQKNSKIISVSSRIHICINLIQIVYTLHTRNKIQNYFPKISIKNFEISRNLTLTFRALSFLSVFPLSELVNTISMIIFEAQLSIFKRDNSIRQQIVKGDEIDDKNWGLSLCISFLRYFLLDVLDDAFSMVHINELKLNKKTTASENKDLEEWKKDKFTWTCQELLVIFGHFQNISSKTYEETYTFEDVTDSEQAIDQTQNT